MRVVLDRIFYITVSQKPRLSCLLHRFIFTTKQASLLLHLGGCLNLCWVCNLYEPACLLHRFVFGPVGLDVTS